MATTLNFFLFLKKVDKKGDKNKLRVVAVTHGDNHQLFIVARRNMTKNLGLSVNFFLSPEERSQEKVGGGPVCIWKSVLKAGMH